MKRFTETSKWDDPWFCSLSPNAKLVWDYVLSKCDNAGVWAPNVGLANFQIGLTAPDWSAIVKELGKNVVVLPSLKWWIPSFIRFQFGELSDAAKVHQSVIKLLQGHGLKDEYAKWINWRLSASVSSEPFTIALPAPKINGTHIPSLSHPNGMPIPPGTSTRQGTGTEIGVQGEEGATPKDPKPSKVRATIEQWIAYCSLNFPKWPEKDIRGAWDHYEKIGWVVGKSRAPVKNWEACARTCFAFWEKDRGQHNNGNAQHQRNTSPYRDAFIEQG
jgi:hypothetical protein